MAARTHTDQALAAHPATYGITLLGGLRLTTDGRRVDLPMGPQRLIAFVALRGHAHRDAIAAALWPDSDARRAAHSLRTELWQVSRLIPGVLGTSGDLVELGPHVAVDVQALARRTRALAVAPQDVPLADLLDVTTDAELLPGWSDEWVVLERERARQEQLHFLEGAAIQLQRRGQYAGALAAALAAVKIDPLRESAHRTVITVHLDEGNLAEAATHYERLAQVLDRELGLRPSHAVSKILHEALSAHWTAPRLAMTPG